MVDEEKREKLEEKELFLSPEKRDLLAEKLLDFGNIAAGSLIFGYVINSAILNSYSLLIGFLIFPTAYIFALKVKKQ